MTLNQKIEELYSSKWTDYSKHLQQLISNDLVIDKPTNPLLLRINEKEYIDSDIRVMIFGQETNDWDWDFKNNIEHCLITYDKFVNTNACYSYGGQFWNGYKKFLSILKQQHPKKRITSIWNNVIKTGVRGRKGKPSKIVYEVERNHFNVIHKEIEILQPNLILFLSGPNYDKEISDALSLVDYDKVLEKYSSRQLARLNLKGHKNVFRTYHPNFLWRNGIDDYFNTIISAIEI